MVEKLKVPDFSASTIDLSSFRLSPLSSSFIYGILVLDVFLNLI